MNIRNIASENEIPKNKEFFETLITGKSFRMERILSFGYPSAEGFWYDQQENEWVLLFQGSATLEFKQGVTMSLSSGDYLLIPKHCKHRVSEVSIDAVWIGVFTK